MSASDLESIQIYLTHDQKEQFQKACKNRHSTMSAELRKFIRAYVNTPWIEERVYYQPVKTN